LIQLNLLNLLKQLYINQEAMKVHLNQLVVCMFIILSGMHHSLCIHGETPVDPFAPGAFQGLFTPGDSIIRDLQDFLPGYMKAKQIPGCAISLIQDHRIAWTEGFGYLNTITRKPVDSETVFEVASNSKLLTSCVALLLVEQGKLSLDKPLNSYLDEPWLPDTTHREEITLRHVLSHSSGLGHNEMNRTVQFPPGTAYQYSNLGFTYLQKVIEQLTGKPLEEVASELVFEPMGMAYTSYTNKKDLRPKLANGHVSGGYLLGISGTLFLISLLVIWLPGILILRVTRKRWLPEKRTLIYGLLLTVLLWLVITFVFFGIIGWLKYAWQIVLFGMAFLSVSVLLFQGGRALVHRLSFLSQRSIRILLFAWMLVVISGLAVMTRSIHNIPVPRWPAIRSMAPASLRTTASDMATFLLGISEPGGGGISVSGQMLDPQVGLHPEISWGLGTGIFHSPHGDALWQWGQNVDFQSLVIFWPEKGSGMVVLTNSAWDEPDVAIEIAQRALGLNLASVLRASHLEFSGELSLDPPGK
jgi:CubicO group peptidase (beta-lactamase class C family)